MRSFKILAATALATAAALFGMVAPAQAGGSTYHQTCKTKIYLDDNAAAVNSGFSNVLKIKILVSTPHISRCHYSGTALVMFDPAGPTPAFVWQTLHVNRHGHAYFMDFANSIGAGSFSVVYQGHWAHHHGLSASPAKSCSTWIDFPFQV